MRPNQRRPCNQAGLKRMQKELVPERLELSTSELLAQHSNRLSYGTRLLDTGHKF